MGIQFRLAPQSLIAIWHIFYPPRHKARRKAVRQAGKFICKLTPLIKYLSKERGKFDLLRAP
jgi:hypothetical protein